MKIALIDYQDSFTYNVYHYLVGMGQNVDVIEDNSLSINDLEKYDAIILSPGPGLPSETESMFAILEKYAMTKKILGICLGMQGIVQFFDGEIYNQENVQHGVQVSIQILENGSLFYSLPKTINVGLYHSWACRIDESKSLLKLAESEEGILMSVSHRSLPIFGVQFHPESIMTDQGKIILENFINFMPQSRLSN